ncbi:DNA polymerase III subunit gamma/tau [Methylibium sp.]|uniref:DNA polymerase III subunit gamma/tau n=1 Tax=Methylibium sp. TaxID=2067992 RepID=UPI0018132627|nr:DNA polymerase III subunit gamma/tau [Methylibium sp.]MBA3590542.1 DNA polymerase III subunit gamma/tau [Methylibium sp.]
MSSLVLARKYRPRSFGEMVGQEHVVQALVNALTTQRLHHAYLFTGTRGVGKTTVSRILAKSLNCTGPDDAGGITPEPCGVCRACTEIDADRFIDYVEMDAASNRGIDEIRDLLERAAYKPAVGRFKVFMIDEVHQLTKDSFNALLKTLEEPPEYLKFVLATTDPEKVLPTVLSRCLQFNLRPMAPETVLGRLQQVLAAEAVDAELAALRLIARAARGSMRDALSLTDQAIAFGGGSLSEAGVRQMLGTVGRSHVLALLDALAGADGAAVVAAVDTLRAEGLAAEGALEEMASLLQQMAVLHVVPDALDRDDPDSEQIERLAGVLPADETQVLYSIALHGRGELPLAPDEYSGLVMVLLRMLAFRPAGAARPAAVPRQTSGTEAAAGAAPAAPSSAAPTSTPRPPAIPSQPPIEASGSLTRPAAAALPLARTPAASSVSVAPVAVNGNAARPAPQPAPANPVRHDTPSDMPPWEDIPMDAYAAEPATPARAALNGVQCVAEPVPRQRTVPRAGRDDDAMQDSPTPQAVVEETAAPSLAAAAAPNPIGDRWAALVAQLLAAGAIAAMVRELALQSECTAIDAGESRINLRVEREPLRNPAHAERLQGALAAALGHAVKLDIEAGSVGDTPARRDAAAREQRQREAEALIRNDPLVLDVMAQFKTARIVPGSIKPV